MNPENEEFGFLVFPVIDSKENTLHWDVNIRTKRGPEWEDGLKPSPTWTGGTDADLRCLKHRLDIGYGTKEEAVMDVLQKFPTATIYEVEKNISVPFEVWGKLEEWWVSNHYLHLVSLRGEVMVLDRSDLPETLYIIKDYSVFLNEKQMEWWIYVKTWTEKGCWSPSDESRKISSEVNAPERKPNTKEEAIMSILSENPKADIFLYDHWDQRPPITVYPGEFKAMISNGHLKRLTESGKILGRETDGESYSKQV